MTEKKQSPDYAKISHATAISLGLMHNRMYRGAVNRCVNLLVHYPEGCSANCAYCGLAKKRPGTYGEKSFIHVEWPLFSMLEIIDAINRAPGYVKRTCISMITNGKCAKHTLSMTEQLTGATKRPVSILTSPTILDPDFLHQAKRCAHQWDTYWQFMEDGLRVFGPNNVGAHLMVGMGESEKEMVNLMDRLWQMGVDNHLFSFFAEEGSSLGNMPQPPWPTYLRIQLARYLIENEISSPGQMAFNEKGSIVDYGVSPERMETVIHSGIPFMTTGCLDDKGEVTCNRPFGNCLPDVQQWNYPYQPNREEISLILKNISKIAA
ncbi:MAG: hypothetical protein B6240_13275 [Desulfobacteraceae bacterium 4572_87]|nr:MAG: hypothetical protein B6240_13275 [Desulfobacteraceae bacterium 4572_87]